MKYGTKVRIKAGFHEGLEGVLVDVLYEDTNIPEYLVRLTTPDHMIPSNTWVQPENLEVINDQ